MSEQMLFQMRFLRKRFDAHFALMRLYSRVDLLVPLEVGLAAEAFVALAADVCGAVGEQVLF